MSKYCIYISFVFVLVSFAACHDEPDYRVDGSLNEYLQRFLHEGALRGKTFDLKAQGIILEYGDLEGGVAGRCYYENPIRIVIDNAYWDGISSSPNAEDLKENLVFHELGHGLLDRRHTNEYLPNGDWKSIMCGGLVKDDRSWNINYRGIRRAYYLDELFNSNAPIPYWANKQFTDSVTEQLIVQDDFNSAIFWPIGNNESYAASYANGYYRFENKNAYGIFVARPVSINSDEDFYLETSLKIESTLLDKQAGLMFGYGQIPISANYFTVSNKNRSFIGHNTCYGWYTELLQAGLQSNEYNTLAIRKIGDEIYYYINGACVYYDQLSINKIGNAFGFEVSGQCVISIDYFYMYTSALRNTSIVNMAKIDPIVLENHKSQWLNK